MLCNTFTVIFYGESMNNSKNQNYAFNYFLRFFYLSDLSNFSRTYFEKS